MKILLYVLLLTLLLSSCWGTDKKNELKENTVVSELPKEQVEKENTVVSESPKEEVEVEKVLTEDEKKEIEKIKSIKSEQSFLLINKLINDNKIDQAKIIIEKEDLSNLVTLKIQAKIAFWEKKYEEALKNEIEVNKILKWVDYNELYFLWVIYDNLWEKEKSKKYISKSLEINKDFKLAKEYLGNLTEKKIINN